MLSRDPSFTEVIQGAAAKLDIQLLEMDDILRYIDLVSQEPFDLVLLDCEGSPAGKHLLSTLRQISANREAVFMIAGAQDEASARHSAMPRNAAASGCVDFVLPPERIAAHLDDRGVCRAQVLVRAIQNRAHAFGHGHVLELDRRNPAEPLRAPEVSACEGDAGGFPIQTAYHQQCREAIRMAESACSAARRLAKGDRGIVARPAWQRDRHGGHIGRHAETNAA